MRAAALLGTTLLLTVGPFLGLIVLVGNNPTLAPVAYCVTGATKGSDEVSDSFTAEQIANAATIIKVGRSRNVPAQGLVIALAASLQESRLRNLSYGDRDSAGLFQMRPSTGWGSFDQVTDPVYAATAFFGGPDVPPANQGLLDIDGWESLSIAEAAQAVERSAYPDAYAKWTDEATQLVERLTSQDLACPTGLAADCPPTGRSVEAGLQPDAVLVVRCAVARFHIASIGGRATTGHIEGSDHYTGRAVDLMIDDWATPAGVTFGDRVASYFIANARRFGVTYIIWRARIWTTERPYWRTYSHPSGGTSPTLLHLDHLHVSVSGNAATNTKES